MTRRPPAPSSNNADVREAHMDTYSAVPRRSRPANIKVSLNLRALVLIGSTLALLALYVILGSSYTRFPGDLAVSTWVQALSSDWLDTFMKTVSAAGTSHGALVALFCAVLVTFFLRGTRSAGFLMMIATVGVLVRVLLKAVIARPRPSDELVRVMDISDSYSFPSGHVMFYMLLLGGLYLLLASRHSGWKIRLAQVIIAFVLILTGISRIYLGVHWLSDVSAGLVYGAALIAVSTWVWRRLTII